jgi:hypothetical protein
MPREALMALDRFLNLVATLFGGVGSIYVLRSLLAMTPDVMERLSRSYFDFSTPQVEALASQKADGIVGTTLVVIALLIAAVTIAFVPDGLRVFESKAIGIGLAVGVTAIAAVVVVLIGDGIQKHQKHAIGRVIVGLDVDRVVKEGRLTPDDASLFRIQARTLLDWTVDEQESASKLFGRLAAYSGRSIPPQLDYSRVELAK